MQLQKCTQIGMYLLLSNCKIRRTCGENCCGTFLELLWSVASGGGGGDEAEGLMTLKVIFQSSTRFKKKKSSLLDFLMFGTHFILKSSWFDIFRLF